MTRIEQKRYWRALSRLQRLVQQAQENFTEAESGAQQLLDSFQEIEEEPDQPESAAMSALAELLGGLEKMAEAVSTVIAHKLYEVEEDED